MHSYLGTIVAPSRLKIVLTVFSSEAHHAYTDSVYDWTYEHYEEAYVSDLELWLEQNYHYLVGPLDPDFAERYDLTVYDDNEPFIYNVPWFDGNQDFGYYNGYYYLDNYFDYFGTVTGEYTLQEWLALYPDDYGWSEYPMSGTYNYRWLYPYAFDNDYSYYRLKYLVN